MIVDSNYKVLRSRAQRNEQYRRIQDAMPGRFKTRQRTLVCNELLSYSIDKVRKSEDDDNLRAQLISHLKEKMQQDRYSTWYWSLLLWWLIPRFVDWFLSKWLDDLKEHGPVV